MAPPGNQAANRENKHQPIVSEETGLLDSSDIYHLEGYKLFIYSPVHRKSISNKVHTRMEKNVIYARNVRFLFIWVRAQLNIAKIRDFR